MPRRSSGTPSPSVSNTNPYAIHSSLGSGSGRGPFPATSIHTLEPSSPTPSMSMYEYAGAPVSPAGSLNPVVPPAGNPATTGSPDCSGRSGAGQARPTLAGLWSAAPGPSEGDAVPPEAGGTI